MSILASAIQSDLEFLLDDQNSERYDFDNDYKPAINAAVRYIVSAFDQAFERGLLSPTVFGELLVVENRTLVIDVSAPNTSLIVVTSSLATIWRLVGIDPTPLKAAGNSAYLSSSGKWATYVPMDEWGESQVDPFAAGSSQGADMQQYRYTKIMTIADESPEVIRIMIEPRPPAGVALIYLRTPTVISVVGDSVEIPYVLYQPLLMTAYRYLMVQAGKEADFSVGISDKEVKELVSLFSR